MRLVPGTKSIANSTSCSDGKTLISSGKSHTNGNSPNTTLLYTFIETNIIKTASSYFMNSSTCLNDTNNSSLTSNSGNDIVLSKSLTWTLNLHIQQTQKITLTYPKTCTLANNGTANQLSKPENNRKLIPHLFQSHPYMQVVRKINKHWQFFTHMSCIRD